MNKIICEVCGTAYPESATQCPICGCVRTANVAESVIENTADNSPRTYTHVKGGRFSKANVKKRNRTNQVSEGASITDSNNEIRRKQPAKKKNNTGLVIAIIILLLAIVVVVMYLAIRVFWNQMPSIDDSTDPPVAEQTESTDNAIPCESLSLDVTQVYFDKIGSARMIYVTAEPMDTTDTILFSSSDVNVATVTENGKIEAVGSGQAEIIVICGEKSAVCTVVCETEEPTEETTVPVLDEILVSAEDVWLNRKDITLSYKGEEWILYSGNLSFDEMEWGSNRDTVASIQNGTVVAEASGMTSVYAVYREEGITGTKSVVVNVYQEADEELWTIICTDSEGNEVTAPITDGKVIFSDLDPSMTYSICVKVSCIIRCAFTDSDYQGVGGHGGVGEDA